MDFRRPIPLWLLLIGILVTAAATSVAFVLPGLLGHRPDFALSFSPAPTVVLKDGGGAFFTVNIRAVNNFTGVVSASLPRTPEGITAKFFSVQNPDAIPLGHNENLTVQIATTVSGNYSVTVQVSSGNLVHSVSVPILAEGINATYNPSPLIIAKGGSASTIVTLRSLNGLYGDLNVPSNLPGTIPSPAAGIFVTFSPSGVFHMSRYGTAMMNFTFQTSSYSLSEAANAYFDICVNAGPVSSCALETIAYVVS